MRVNNFSGYLLCKLAEECVEVSHAVHKVICFGPRSRVSETSVVDNLGKVASEIKDVLGTLDCLIHNQVLTQASVFDEEAFYRKQIKIARGWRSSLKNSMGWEGTPTDISVPCREADDRQLCLDFGED